MWLGTKRRNKKLHILYNHMVFSMFISGYYKNLLLNIVQTLG